ncbi:AraC family transcriptional regulator [Caballeronia udeis]|uniref:AraC family transcriptional regulator n=1 Tax=Caballeronia udeis TaxID=1232866 RepID=A0A158GQF8_9BURK|nr:helix-turn-helix domain-containing protein [Caballeronia udeis]SAL34107.1 AraC family transcriptional regulator [Caballeronia udeis]
MRDAERNLQLLGLDAGAPIFNWNDVTAQVGIVFFLDSEHGASDNVSDTINCVLHVINEMPSLEGADGRIYNVRLLLTPRTGPHAPIVTQYGLEQREAPTSASPATSAHVDSAPARPWTARFQFNDGTGKTHLKSQVAASRGNEKILASTKWLATNCDRLISVADAARAVAMSKRNFLRRFREEMGVTPSEYLLCARLNRTCQLLKESNLPIDKIARRSGMGSGARLAKVFRKRLNMSPTAFRARARVEVTRANFPSEMPGRSTNSDERLADGLPT